MKKTFVPFILALVCVLLLVSCAPKQVENKEIEVVFNGSTRTCLYTGEYLMKPVGVGEYKFSEDGEEWIFTGEAGEKSEIGTGSVEDMPLVIKHDGEKYETYYTGALVDSEPVDPVQITDFPYTLKYEDEELEGLFTGSIFNNLPEGSGKFTYEDKGDYFEYSGDWKAGEMSGQGTVDSNCFVIHFPEVDREGSYKGDVVNGVPDGNGDFSAINGENVKYDYSGNWKDGLYEGKGHLEYDSDDYWTLDGNFEGAEFFPSVADLYVAAGTMKTSAFSISSKEYEYISSHENLFTGKVQEVDDSFISKDFKYEQFSKNTNAYELSIIKVSGLSVIQVFEEQDVYGYDLVYILASDSKYRVYNINMIGTAPNIVEGSRISFVGMPVDYFTYKSVSGSDIWAIACIGITLSKQ
jgi:hypothetical protein